jgi:hypothetical protein
MSELEFPPGHQSLCVMVGIRFPLPWHVRPEADGEAVAGVGTGHALDPRPHRAAGVARRIEITAAAHVGESEAVAALAEFAFSSPRLPLRRRPGDGGDSGGRSGAFRAIAGKNRAIQPDESTNFTPSRTAFADWSRFGSRNLATGGQRRLVIVENRGCSWVAG